MGAANRRPSDLLEAAGREMGKLDGAQCFHCHATNAGEGLRLEVANLTPGIQCERCHGPAAEHAVGFENGKTVPMKKLTDGTAEQMNAFCGSCHRTWDEIAAGPKLGVASVRFQPYRITNSKCYDSADARISCVACHDPHRSLNTNEASYDAKCQACHSAGANSAAKLCKVSKNNCASCHMPAVEMPGSHHRFTDHQIRIVRVNEPFPD
jgi:Zn finger protein HypA/HybF involved in hydrogenase expression